MGIEEVFDYLPFCRELGIEITEAADGRARGRLELGAEHSSNPNTMVAHGGVPYSLADTVGGAAAVSVNRTVTPTVDMRIDYLAPATGGVLHAEAEVVRNGNSVATVDVTVRDDSGTRIAEARGVYKTDGGGGESAWSAGAAEAMGRTGEAGDDADTGPER